MPPGETPPAGEQPPGETQPPVADGELSFGDATIEDQTYVTREKIDALTLPEATGGSGTVTYGMTALRPLWFSFLVGEDRYPIIPGLVFTPGERTLSGTPAVDGIDDSYIITYYARDEAGGRAELTFRIFVVKE